MLVFNFHHVEPVPLPNTAERGFVSITPEGLSRFIRMLRLLRYRIVSIREVLQAGDISRMGRRDVLLTFDDGFEDNLVHGLPVFEREKCPALIFILPGRFGGSNAWDQGHLPLEQQDRLMTLDQLKTLGDSPWVTYGSHGMLHRHLPELSADAIRWELEESYDILSKELTSAFVPVFAYPWGEYSDKVLERMPQTPYQYAFTTEKRPWTADESPYAIPRYTAFLRDGNPMVLFGKLCRHKVLLP